ncbi:MAG: hypothetical protein WCL39_13845, partial [Armatimonadota bacterium]
IGLLPFVLSGCSRAPATTQAAPSRIDIAFSRPLLSPSAVYVAPDGKAAAYLDSSGKLLIMSDSGERVGSYLMEGAGKGAISNGGQRAILCGISHGRWELRVIRGNGTQIWRQWLEGAVTDVAITPDGRTAFAAQANARVYIFDLSQHLKPRWRRIRASYAFSRLVYSEKMDAMIVQTANPLGFGVSDLDGQMRWWKPQPPGRFSLETGANGSLILTMIGRLSPEPGVEVSLYDTSGTKLFGRQIQGFDSRAEIAADGRAVAVSFRAKLTHKNKSVMERRVALWSVDGRTLWEQGGLFFRPVLQGLTGDPLGVLVAEDYKLLSGLDNTGRLAWRGPELQASLRDLVHDESWRLAWAQYTNGRLELWKLQEP